MAKEKRGGKAREERWLEERREDKRMEKERS